MSNYDPRDHMHGGGDVGCAWLVFAVAVVAIVATAVLMTSCGAHAHEAGPLMPPGVKVQALPPITTPSPSGKQPTGWSYPWACCSGMDCSRSSQPGDISETPTGYRINLTGEIVAFGDKRIKDSPDGDFHWCAHRGSNDIDQAHTICLFVPPRGF